MGPRGIRPEGAVVMVVSGSGASGSTTSQVRVAGVGSVLPAASIARTRTVRWPGASVGRTSGLAQSVNDAPSRAHSNLTPDSLALNDTDAGPGEMVPAGPAVISVTGGVVSMRQVRLAGVVSVLPAGSVARIRTVCSPSVSPVRTSGLAHGVNGAASSAQVNVAPASLAVKVMVAAADATSAAGPAVMVVAGAVVSAGGGVCPPGPGAGGGSGVGDGLGWGDGPAAGSTAGKPG